MLALSKIVYNAGTITGPIISSALEGKMKMLLKGAFLLHGCLSLSVVGVALAEDKAVESYTYGTYFVCDVTQQDRADKIFKALYQPLHDAAVTDGSLAGYGLYAHQTGGKWRRLMYAQAPSIQALMDAEKKIHDQAEAQNNKKLNTEFGKICNSHEDYIWRTIAGNLGTSAPGNAVFSTYFVCNSHETQADAIVKQVFAPLYDKLVTEGKLKTWGYLEHIVGGHIRRVATMSAADMNSLMATRAEINKVMKDNVLGDMFTEICDSHEDYMWDLKASRLH